MRTEIVNILENQDMHLPQMHKPTRLIYTKIRFHFSIFYRFAYFDIKKSKLIFMFHKSYDLIDMLETVPDREGMLVVRITFSGRMQLLYYWSVVKMQWIKFEEQEINTTQSKKMNLLLKKIRDLLDIFKRLKNTENVKLYKKIEQHEVKELDNHRINLQTYQYCIDEIQKILKELE